MNTSKFLVSLIFITAVSSTQAENISQPEWSGSISAEREYDSAVSLEQIDRVSRESDYANQLSWSFSGKWQVLDRLKLAASYQGKQRVYDKASEFDLEQHHVAFSSKYTYAKLGYSYRYDQARARVDGDKFLIFSQSALAIDRLFASRYFLRAGLARNQKDFSALNERDAKADALTLDSMIFFQQGRNHIGFHLSVEDETARVNRYDKFTESLRVSYQQAFSAGRLPATWLSSLQYTRSRYASFRVDKNGSELPVLPAASNSEKRRDQKLHWRVGLELALNDWLEVLLQGDYLINDSNYASVDYNEKRFSLGLKASF